MTCGVGVTVRTTKGRPHLRGVVVDRAGAFLRSFEHQCNAGKDHDMLHALGQALATDLAAQPVDFVLIREAGFSRAAGLTATVKTRLRAEGVGLGVARAVTQKAAVLDVAGIGLLLGVAPDEADRAGQVLAGDEFADPGAAALAALHL